jgi:hypothetical protein
MTLDFSDARIRHVAQFIGSVGVILSALWFVGEPMAQGYIKEQVIAENTALKKSIEDANRNVEKTKQELQVLQRKSDQAQSDLKVIKELAREQRQLMYQLLQSRNGQ